MAILLDSVIGQQNLKEELLDSLRADRLPASFIIAGPEGVGKASIVRGLLQAANCQHAELACGRCSNCLRAIEKQNEMIIEISPESKKVISVDQVRDLHQQLSLQVADGQHRFILITPAERLSLGAANALLKVLEEPPERTHFFLLTSQVARLLPTLRSRSQIFHAQPLSYEELTRANKFTPTALRWCGGSWERAEKLITPDGEAALFASLNFLKILVGPSLFDWKKEAAWFFQDDEARNFCISVWGEALRQRINGNEVDLAFLPGHGATIVALYDALVNLQQELEGNVDKLLSIEVFYYQIQEMVRQEQGVVTNG